MAVVKADAYGHGAVNVAKVAINSGASYLGVATVHEAIKLREANIEVPILVFTQPPETAIELLLDFDIIPTIYKSDFAVNYAEKALEKNCKAKYHLAINTGMNRIGVDYNKIIEFLKQVSFHKALQLEGTFTHFATADNKDLFDFKKQYVRFCDCLESMKNFGIDPGIVHCANSAAIFRFPETHFDMVRLGICMYGCYPCDDIKDKVDLRPVMSCHAKIHDEHILNMGDGVSYGMNYRAPGKVQICSIPIGYADGLSRIASQKISVIYKGKKFPQVGNICMDQCMFEIDRRYINKFSNLEAHIGDEVILLGKQDNAEILLEDLAKFCNTIVYEIMCGFSLRMPRIYKK